MPSREDDVERDRAFAVQLGGALQDAFVTVAFDAAIEKLIAGNQLVEQTSPAAQHAKNHRIAPNHRQFPLGINGIALKPNLIGLEDYAPVRSDERQIRATPVRHPIEIKTLKFARRHIRWNE